MIDIDGNESLRKKFLQTGDLLVKSGTGSNSRRTHINKVKENKKKSNKGKSKKNIYRFFLYTTKGIWTVSKTLGGILLIVSVLVYIYGYVFL